MAVLDDSRLQAAELLTSAGADLEATTDFGETAIIVAAKMYGENGSNRKALEFLIGKKVNINARDRNGYTALKAIKTGSLTKYPLRRSDLEAGVNLLLKAGATN